ncbi:MAG: hypothetical protein HC869_14570 [Rhodospirillales bacterium]|nr:hypothetical protein [Rhodospirillales bacterium]
MAGERNIDYEALAQSALRGIVRTVLLQAAKSGLPGQHHFYIAFSTSAPGAILSPRLKERYPEEMTIVLQHRFWDLLVSDERFEVKLTFDGIPERLVVPFAAIKVFFDPSVPYGLQFEGSDLATDMAQDLGSHGDRLGLAPHASAARASKSGAQGHAAPAGRVDKKPRSPRKPRAGKADAPSEASKSRTLLAAGAEASGPAKETRPKTMTSKPERPDAPANDTKVIQLDKFRKK